MIWHQTRLPAGRIAARRHQSLGVELPLKGGDNLPVRCLGLYEALHGINCRTIWHTTDFSPSLDQRVIAFACTLDSLFPGPIKKQRDRAHKATIGQAGQSNQRLYAMCNADTANHVNIVAHLSGRVGTSGVYHINPQPSRAGFSGVLPSGLLPEIQYANGSAISLGEPARTCRVFSSVPSIFCTPYPVLPGIKRLNRLKVLTERGVKNTSLLKALGKFFLISFFTARTTSGLPYIAPVPIHGITRFRRAISNRYCSSIDPFQYKVIARIGFHHR